MLSVLAMQGKNAALVLEILNAAKDDQITAGIAGLSGTYVPP